MSINYDTLFLMLKFAGAMIALLMLIFLIAVLTPKLAKLSQKIIRPRDEKPSDGAGPARVEDNVKSIYDAQKDDDTNENQPKG